MKAFGSVQGGPWHLVNQVGSSAEGKSRLQNLDGTIVSIQPGGGVGSRPEGTDGPWEQCAIEGGVAVFTVEGVCWPFAVRNA